MSRDELVADLVDSAGSAPWPDGVRSVVEAVLDRLEALGWGPMPAGVLRVDRRLTADELDRLKAAFHASTGGDLYVLDDGPRPATSGPTGNGFAAWLKRRRP